ncbi:hypothetical protein, partial [Methylicorpusculum sp.]
MADTNNAIKAYQLFNFLLSENGPLYSLRKECTDADESSFAKDEKFINVTNDYLRFVIKHWKEVNRKQVKLYEFPKLEDLQTQSINREQVLPTHNQVNNRTETRDSIQQTASKSTDGSITTSERNLSTTMIPDNLSYKPGAVPQ